MLDTGEKIALAVGTLIILGYFAFWGVMLYIAWHFISKFW